jgi:AraC-like DNA-binding protein
MTYALALSAPDSDITSSAASSSSTPEIARRVIGYVMENFAEEICLDDLADAAGMSRFNFCRKFHRDCGLPPVRWLWNFRVILAHEFIALDPTWNLTEVAFACGFTSSAHFSRAFKGVFKVSPSKYRKDRLARDLTRRKSGSMDALYTRDSSVLNNAMSRSLTLVPAAEGEL